MVFYKQRNLGTGFYGHNKDKFVPSEAGFYHQGKNKKSGSDHSTKYDERLSSHQSYLNKYESLGSTKLNLMREPGMTYKHHDIFTYGSEPHYLFMYNLNELNKTKSINFLLFDITSVNKFDLVKYIICFDGTFRIILEIDYFLYRKIKNATLLKFHICHRRKLDDKELANYHFQRIPGRNYYDLNYQEIHICQVAPR